jgi:hypothetical protein
VEGIAADEIARLSDAKRDRVGEIAFRFYAGLAWRADWAAIAAEHHSDRPAPTALGRADRAFFQRR